MSYPYLIQGNNVVVVIGNKSHTVSKTHITYDKVIAAIKAQDWDAVKEVIEPKKVVLSYGKGNVTINGETLLWKGQELNTGLAVRMIQMLKEGFPIEPMVLFMENLMLNPSRRSVQELYGFLEKSNLPITPDGHFLAYKKVRANYFDCHSGTMDNSVGQVVEMERNTVDDDKDRTCSAGLHFCSQSYLAHFGGERIMILKINPRDVVSIPSDYNDAKGRACRYEVIGELNVTPDEAFTKPVQTTAVGSQPVQASGKVVTGPKTGSSTFYQGYSCGFSGEEPTSQYEYDVAYSEGYDKGSLDFDYGYAERYRFVAHVQVSTSGPKIGSTPFYRGYTDGFLVKAPSMPGLSTSMAWAAYSEGYDKGSKDASMKVNARYQFVEPVAVSNTPWPYPRRS